MAINQITFSQNGIEKEKLNSDIAYSNKLLSDLNDDGKITPFEKNQLADDFAFLKNSYDVFKLEIASYNLQTSKQAVDLETAYKNLYDQLYSVEGGVLSDMNTTSVINTETIRNAFISFYVNRDNVSTLINTTINQNATDANQNATDANNNATNANNAATEANKNSEAAKQEATQAKKDAEAAKQEAIKAAEVSSLKTAVYTQATEPANVNLKAGDIWYKTGVTVDSSGRSSTGIVAVFVYNGTAWEKRLMDYNSLSVGKLSALTSDLGVINAGDIYGTNIYGANIEGAKITSKTTEGTRVDTTEIVGSNITLNSINGEFFSSQNVNVNPTGFTSQGENGKGWLLNNRSQPDNIVIEELHREPYNHNGEIFDDFPMYSKSLEIKRNELNFYRKDENIYSSNYGNRTAVNESVYITGGYEYAFDNDVTSAGAIKGKSFTNSSNGGSVTVGANSIAIGGGFSSIETNMSNVSIGSRNIYAPGVYTDALTLDNKKIKFDTGKVTLSNSSGTPVSTSVRFSTKFTNAPVVMTNCPTTVIGKTVLGTAAANIDSLGCDIYMTRINATATSVTWFAFGE